MRDKNHVLLDVEACAEEIEEYYNLDDDGWEDEVRVFTSVYILVISISIASERLFVQGVWVEAGDEPGDAAVVNADDAAARYPWEKSAMAASLAAQAADRSTPFEFAIVDAEGHEKILGHRAWNTFYKQKHKPASANPNLQAVVASRSRMLARATRGDWDTRLITMPMVLARAIAERKATMQQNLQLQRFIQKRALKLGTNYNKMFVCNKANNAQVIDCSSLCWFLFAHAVVQMGMS
jgi:hypothetical protein